MSTVKNLLSFLLFISLILLNGCGDEDDAPVAAISTITPNEAPIGKMVTITGANFSITSSENVVEFNGVSARVISSTNTSIEVKVPKGATTGMVTVTVSGNSKATSALAFVVTDCSDCGVIEKFALSNDYNYSIEPINGTKLAYDNSLSTTRGFHFSVDKKVRIKSFGGLFRKKGSYPMELRVYGDDPAVYTTTITANDTENFVYQEVDIDLQLAPGIQYVLRYCSENHDSVYDLSLPNQGASYLQPFDLGGVTLIKLNYGYNTKCTIGFGHFYMTGLQSDVILMRGIVDFKYEIIE